MAVDPRTTKRGLPVGRAYIGALVLVGLGAAASPFFRIQGGSPPGDAIVVGPKEEVSPGIQGDPRIRAFMGAYGEFVEEVTFSEDDARFTVSGKPIHFEGGKMLSEEHVGDADQFDPVFYAYPLEGRTVPAPPDHAPVYSTDLLEALFGGSERQIRSHGLSTTFLDRKVFVNRWCLDALRAIETEIRQAARTDAAVASWLEGLRVAYSFQDRDIRGSENRSYHAWGLAIDLVPASFQGRHVYWRWSRVFDRQWHAIPLEDRWSPPEAVIRAFEENGFVWGGKWARFDVIHFEYRPEILLYNKLLQY